MGTFDSHFDTPFQIQQEGEELEIKFERTGASTGRVLWNIPPPSAGCNSTNQAYCGIVILLNTIVNKPVLTWPKNGVRYSADPTADVDLHAGDKIGGAFVVGAFYQDRTTTSLDISGLQSDAAYFITAHAVDCQLRYHERGMSAYSLPWMYGSATDDTCSWHEITLGGVVSGTDSTGLDPAVSYDVDIEIDKVKYTLTISGADAQTYDDLVAALNKQIKLLSNPVESPIAPNTGAYYYNKTTKKLYQWDGDEHIEIAVINELTDPTDVEEGEYWEDTDDGILYRREGSPLAWVEQNPFVSGFDPADPPCDAFWIQTSSPTLAWKWNGSTWCARPLFQQTKNPSCAANINCSEYWYAGSPQTLFGWDEATELWAATDAIQWNVDPRTPVVGTLWYNTTTEELFERAGSPVWNPQIVITDDEEPTLAAVGTYWYNPVTQDLMLKTAGSPAFVEVAFINWGSDPTQPDSCSLWWNTATDVLYVWDVVNNQWTEVVSFTISDVDPASPAAMENGTIWAQITGSPEAVTAYWEWDGSQFVLIPAPNVMEWPTDPTDVVPGDVWYDTFTEQYFELVGATWVVIDVISSANDPTSLPIGTFWFNQTNNTLNMWNGIAWVNVMYSSSPLYPVNGFLWYDSDDDILYQWDSASKSWVIATPLAVVTMNDPKGCEPDGNIIFTSSQCGGCGNMLVGTPSVNTGISFSAITYSFGDTTLFPSLDVTATLLTPVAGGDGLSGVPSYKEIGVGDNGDPGPRRELADNIRKQLGYPTVEVELTKYQLDQAIDQALEELRLRSASAYRRVYFFIDVKTGIQNYRLTNECVGFNKIVNVMGAWRVSSAFMGIVHAGGVYGQTVLQHLYSMGTYDLVSYHIVSDYIEQLEQLFATRITYTFDEASRELYFFQHFNHNERILLDCVIERTEQELITGRWTRRWIQQWAEAEAREMLAEVRGKFATLPGAGGGVSLNAADLTNSALELKTKCMEDIDNFVVNDVENLGIGSEFIIG